MSSNKPKSDDDTSSEPANWDHSTHAEQPTLQSPASFENQNPTQSGFELADSFKNVDTSILPIEFGNYQLLEVVGQGGAGIVFRAKPIPNHKPAEGFEVVAVKLIRAEIMASPQAVKRFEKEARLQAEVDSPYVTRCLEFGREQGTYFIVSEFVDGAGLNEVVNQLSSLPDSQSLRVIADVLKALTAMHLSGVIHRDIKPGNIIAKFHQCKKGTEPFSFDNFEIAKLTDFGLARHIEQSESLAMTRQKTLLGTPLYMAPEQHFESRAVDARADIYSVGVTLYQMLSGRLPFESSEIMELAEMHRVERPKPLTLIRQGTSEAVNNVVLKALEKDPNLRYQNAFEMLADVQRILDHQPTSIRLYPETPDAFHAAVKNYDFEWILNATPKQLWPLVADTDRFNRAIGLPAVEFTFDHAGGKRRIFAEAKFNGLKVRWREHPFQWICEREMSVLREFEAGPFEWVTSTVELHPLAGQKTRLIHRFQVKPRGLFGKLMTPIQFNFMTKRSLNRVYPRLEQIANDQSCGFACDVSFARAPQLTAAQRKFLERRSDKLGQSIGNVALAQNFSELLATVADPFAVRIRPIPLAEKLSCSRDESLGLCLAGVEAGLLEMAWDVICPVCRIAASNVSSLEKVESHSQCQVCDLEFEVDFSKSVEAIFGVHPEIRLIERKTFCIGGPYHAPHVLAQNRLLSQQHVDVGAEFSTGTYEVRGPQLDAHADISVNEKALAHRIELTFGNSDPPGWPDLQTGQGCIHIVNDSDVEILVRLEQKSDRGDAITAASASRHPMFKKLFPSEFKSVRHLVELTNVYLLGIKHCDAESLLDQVGDIQVREIWNQVQALFPTDQITGCSIVECTHEQLVVSFGLLEDLLTSLQQLTSVDVDVFGLDINDCCFAINSGAVMVGLQANQPATFGKTVRYCKSLLFGREAGILSLTNEVYSLLESSESESAKELLLEYTKTDQGDEVITMTRG